MDTNTVLIVIGNKSVYEGDLIYWSKKNAKQYSGPLANQGYRCGKDWIEFHHKNGVNSDFRRSNVEVLHRSCHQDQPVHREILLKRK
jgi:hypothetical protein